jgi:hypothetical protein
MNNTYRYGSHADPEPTALFLFRAADRACAPLPVHDVEYVIPTSSGLPLLRAPAIRYSAVASPQDTGFR